MINKLLLIGALSLAPTIDATENVEDETPVETPTEDETKPVWEEKVYTFTCDEYVAKVTLTSKVDYTMETKYKDDTQDTLTSTYELNDNILTLYSSIKFVKLGDFEIGANNVLTKYEPKIEVPTNTDEAVDVLKVWLNKWLAPEMVSTIVVFITLLVIVAIYLFKDTKNKKLAHLNNEELEKHIFSKIDALIESDMAKEMDKVAPEILGNLKTSNEIMKVFAKIICLAQENTPESRVAIVELISKLGSVDEKTTQMAKQVIENEKKEKENKKIEQNKQLDEIIEDTKKDDGTTI